MMRGLAVLLLLLLGLWGGAAVVIAQFKQSLPGQVERLHRSIP